MTQTIFHVKGFKTRFRPDLLYLLLCFPVFVSFTLLSIKNLGF